MKSTGTSLWQSPNTDATNETGFTGLPGGYRNNSATFVNIGNWGLWYSSLELTITSARGQALIYNSGTLYSSNINKTAGVSVRCLRD
jgi:uncharacterized protein (TIGR02145 family)